MDEDGAGRRTGRFTRPPFPGLSLCLTCRPRSRSRLNRGAGHYAAAAEIAKLARPEDQASVAAAVEGHGPR